MGKVIVSATKLLFVDIKKIQFVTSDLKPFDKNGFSESEILKLYEDGKILVKSFEQIEKVCNSSEIDGHIMIFKNKTVMKRYSSHEEIKQAVDNGVVVYYESELYKVKKMCGAHIVFCESSSFSGGLIELYDFNEFYSL